MAYNVDGLLLVWNLKNVKPGYRAKLKKLNLKFILN